ncbi:MAG TPA: S8 family serine peptidase [Candidatus Limnocylindria bacterium]|nr:S8 family serine peptidase [Candidatus Limnocylindria bacterium]
MNARVGTRTVGRSVAAIVIAALLLGTSWTGRTSVARVDVDPALRAGDIAILQVAPETAWTVAADLIDSGATEVTAFDSVNVVSARLSDRALTAIATDRSVLRASSDAGVRAAGGPTGNGKDLDSFGALSKKDSVGIDAIFASAAWPLSTGAGVVVAVMDSGIGAHPDLPDGKVVARANFAGTAGVGLDPAGHGTHLAGIIAAKGTTFRGVAPDARLVDIRVLDQNGHGTLHDVVEGFDWLLENRRALGIRVLNLSLGTTQRYSYHEDLLSALAESAWFAGIAVVAAAGNDGPSGGTVATPGSDPFVITAGSFDDQGTPALQDDRESAFSSRGPTIDGYAKPDVLAPGRRVVSLRAMGSQLELSRPERVVGSHGNATKGNTNLYIRMSGTSVSSAMVSGVAALVLSVHPDYTPTKTKGAIVASGRSLTDSPRRAVSAATAVFAFPRAVNAQLLPSRLLMTTLENSGVVDEGTTWEDVTWEGVTWEAVTWESVTWESVTWESVSWEGVMWETVNGKQDPLLDSAR